MTRRRLGRAAVVLAALTAAWACGCQRGRGAEEGAGAKVSAPPAVSSRTRHGGLDVTFLVTADTHFGYREGAFDISTQLDEEIKQMNGIAGRSWPLGLPGRVGVPRGVLVAGDLTDAGEEGQWKQFEAAFGLTGKEGKVKFPVYESIGNHDRYNVQEYVARQVARRHGRTHYSWDWDDLHMVCIGEGADDETLAWLARDLAAAGTDVPVVVYLHFSLAGPYSDSNWFGKGDYHDKFAAALKGYNVIGIFHGHYHASRRYQWKGYDVYCVGSAKHAAKCFAVVHVTDRRMTVASWYWHGIPGWWWSHDKAIRAPATMPAGG